jgi:hypothetical protein
MDIEQSPSGQIIKASTGYKAFIPAALPPKLEWDDVPASFIKKQCNSALYEITVGTGAQNWSCNILIMSASKAIRAGVVLR